MSHQFYFVRKGIHTHIILPSENLLSRIPALLEYTSDSPWLRVGWGDAGYYGAPRQNIWLALRALVLPSPSVIEICPCPTPARDADSETRLYPISASAEQFNRLVDFVSRHFSLNRDNQLNWVRSKADGAQFFSSRGIYSALNTCNNWTARALACAGLKIHARLQFLPGPLEQSIRRLGYIQYRPATNEPPPTP